MDRRFRTLSKLALPMALALLSGCGLLNAAASLAPLAATKLQFSCLPEGTKVDTPDGMRRVENLRAGDLVIGFDGETVKVLQKHSYAEDETVDFLTVVFDDGARVDLCGMHRIAGSRAKHLSAGDSVGDRMVEQVIVYQGVVRSYDLLTEDDGYRIHGVPVNSMIEEMYATSASGDAPGAD